ncbi:MAG: glutathione peroxidase [Bacilli bacterium]|nr:glutathione peroxidase [Bacilli bacterium]
MSLYKVVVENMDGTKNNLEEYKNKVLLVVNTATGCGFTPQYVGLQNLYEKYKDKGLEILDFPCNQFANQAKESNNEIHDFCVGRFGIKFKQFAKVDVNGKDSSEIYKYLKKNSKGLLGKSIKWNFTKFLIDRDGNIVKRFSPMVEPEDIEKDIIKLL